MNIRNGGIILQFLVKKQLSDKIDHLRKLTDEIEKLEQSGDFSDADLEIELIKKYQEKNLLASNLYAIHDRYIMMS